jgi:phospholipid/cholesterol/gamma-HCH transport system substrate-binding protein
METDRNYFLVGLFVIAVTVGAVFFGLWLTTTTPGETMRYRIAFRESVEGLKVGQVVRFLGVDVGNIKSIKIDPDDSQQVQIDADILKSAPIKTGTVATMQLQNLTGDMYIELTGGDPKEPKLADVSNDVVPEIRSQPSTLSVLEGRLPQLLDHTKHAADQVDKMFSDQNVHSMQKVVKDLSKYFGSDDDKDKDKDKDDKSSQ